MINFIILNKSKPKTLLLIHGLFTSSGYWLPYLQILKGYRLVILDIGYQPLCDVDYYVGLVGGIIEAEAGGVVDAVISHSLGTMIASRLPEDIRLSSFEICPVYFAARRNTGDFVSEIAGKIKFPMSGDEIRNLLADVDGVLSRYSTAAQTPIRNSVYLPDADLYFSYDVRSEFKVFEGDHFNIAKAMIDIEGVLAA
jgi:pimeloyl-ACP methyl ester carboxylesterase